MILFYMLIRWTIPRFRFDQLMGLAWKVLMPLSLVNLVFVLLLKHYDLSQWFMLPISIVLFIGSAWLTLRLPQAPTCGWKIPSRAFR